MNVYIILSYWDPDGVVETKIEAVFSSEDSARAHIKDMEKSLKEEYENKEVVDYICSRVWKEEVKE